MTERDPGITYERINDRGACMEQSKTYKQRILDFLATVGPAGASNAQIRAATGIPSHQQVYLLTQELAARKEISAGRKGSTWIFYTPDAAASNAIEGFWRVVSSPDFDRDYLELETDPFVRVWRGTHLDFTGEFHIGLIHGELAGRVDGKRVLFSFEGADEMDPVHGAGTLTLREKRLELRLLFHYGDEFTFLCERSEPSGRDP